MSGSLEGKYIRLELIRVNNLPLPSERIPAGFYVPINVDPRRRWTSAVRVVSSDESEVLGDTVLLSLHEAMGKSLEKFETSWDELLDRGDEHFDISFPPVHGDHSSLTLKAAVLHDCDNQDSTLFDTARNTDADHEQSATYVTTEKVSHLNDAVGLFTALNNLARARIQSDIQDIDFITSLFHEALAFRPQGHPDHPLSIYHLTEALTWHHTKEHTAVYFLESAQLSCKLLPLCTEGTYLRSIAAGADGAADYVIRECNTLPTAVV
ncbi:hypothetical protein BDR05DRAFT_1002877 [Suillus weaverae]|nr:hypothetical protein BDR05DRAFT_1002877 [Suillus weaverae]